MAALTSSAGPFYAKDSNGTLQRIKVFDLKSPVTASEDLIAGYAYIEATGSTLDVMTGSLEKLTDISSSLSPLSSIEASMDYLTGSYERLTDISSALEPLGILEQAINQVTHSVDNNTKYVEQLLMFNRATNVYTKIYQKEDLFEDGTAVPYDIYEESELNPLWNTPAAVEQISKAVDVVIQNSTNKNLYLKINYNPGTDVSTSDYTVKLLPGIIYNSESKIAHIRHKFTFADEASASFVGEVPISVIYNNGLNNDLSIGQTTPGQDSITSIATNVAYMSFTPVVPQLVAEWYYDINVYQGMVIRGQARISKPGQEITLYVTNDPSRNNKLSGFDKTIEYAVVDDEPTDFDLTFTGPDAPTQSGRYELIAVLDGTGDIGDARVLFADLARYIIP